MLIDCYIIKLRRNSTKIYQALRKKPVDNFPGNLASSSFSGNFDKHTEYIPKRKNKERPNVNRKFLHQHQKQYRKPFLIFIFALLRKTGQESLQQNVEPQKRKQVATLTFSSMSYEGHLKIKKLARLILRKLLFYGSFKVYFEKQIEIIIIPFIISKKTKRKQKKNESSILFIVLLSLRYQIRIFFQTDASPLKHPLNKKPQLLFSGIFCPSQIQLYEYQWLQKSAFRPASYRT